MLVKDLQKANTEYRRIRNLVPLGVLRSAEDYEKAVVVDEILAKIVEDEEHLLPELAEALRVFIKSAQDTPSACWGSFTESYEETHTKLPAAPPRAVLKVLINEHDLNNADLPELATQGVISKILSDKRDLNVRQIKLLAKQFDVSPAVFL